MLIQLLIQLPITNFGTDYSITDFITNLHYIMM